MVSDYTSPSLGDPHDITVYLQLCSTCVEVIDRGLQYLSREESQATCKREQGGSKAKQSRYPREAPRIPQEGCARTVAPTSSHGYNASPHSRTLQTLQGRNRHYDQIHDGRQRAVVAPTSVTARSVRNCTRKSGRPMVDRPLRRV